MTRGRESELPMVNAARTSTPRTPQLITVVIWFAVSVVSAFGLLALQDAIGLDTAVLPLVMFSPTIGAVACRFVARGGIAPYPPVASPPRWATAVGLSTAAVIVYFAVMPLLGDYPSQSTGVPVAVIVAATVIGALGEEIGFRGVLLHTVSQWISRPWAAILTGLLFGFWHIQCYGLPLLQFACFIIAAVVLTVTMASVMIGAFWQQLAVCTIIHAGANLSLTFLGGDSTVMTGLLVATVAAGAVVVPLAVWLIDRRR